MSRPREACDRQQGRGVAGSEQLRVVGRNHTLRKVPYGNTQSHREIEEAARPAEQ